MKASKLALTASFISAAVMLSGCHYTVSDELAVCQKIGPDSYEVVDIQEKEKRVIATITGLEPKLNVTTGAYGAYVSTTILPKSYSYALVDVADKKCRLERASRAYEYKLVQ